jgi:hypothetical protein
MSLRVWDERVLPRLTDRSLRGHDVGERRRATCAGLTGRVLEIGFGSGLNVRWYPPDVSSVTAIEPSDLGWELSAGRRSRGDVPVHRGGLDGQRLDLPDDSHDSALVTSSLCTVPDPLLALREARRGPRAGLPARTGLRPAVDVRLPAGGPLTPPERLDGWGRAAISARGGGTRRGRAR